MKVAFYGLLTLAPAAAMAAEVATGEFEGFSTVVKPFMEAHCIDCHGPNKQKAGFRVDTLAGDLNNGTEALHWREIVDIVNSGEMPPEGRPRPDSARSAVVTQSIHEALTRAEMARASDGGRVVMRRLSRAEYLNTMRDLFGFTSDPIAANSLPADTSALGFDNIGAVMTMDPISLGQYVKVAGDVVQLATTMGQTKPVTNTQRWEGEAYKGKANPQAIKKAYEEELKRATAEGNPPPTLSEVEERLRNQQLNESYAMRDDAIGIKRKAGAGRRLQFSVKNIQPGDYRLRVRAAKEQHHSEWPVQLGMGLKMGSFRAPESGRLESSVTEEMGIYTSIAHNHTYRGDGTLVITFDFSDRRPSGETSGIEDTHPALQGVSEKDLLLVDWVELEGPLVEAWPPAPYATLFFEGPRSQPDRDYADRILQRFLSQAFRGPVELEQKNKYLEIYDLAVAEKYSFEEALGFAAQAALSSPEFLYLVETKADDGSGKVRLNDYQLASRLSYFLWSTLPDEELAALAADGQLSSPDILAQQVKRMLASPRAQAFVENFTGQWLKLRELGSMAPSSSLFPNYDNWLERAMRQETEMMFSEVLHNDLNVLCLLSSDWSYLNERLARHYGIPGVYGPEMRKVTLDPKFHRSGVLTQGSILTLTSDAIRTKPVTRGAYILTNILGTPPPPPPPDAGELPDVPNGEQITVKERLSAHRKLDSCAACHNKIDPLGFVLENYDAVGAWRDVEQIPTSDVALASNGAKDASGANDSKDINDQKYKIKEKTSPPKSIAIDPSGSLPDGTSFRDYKEFQEILLRQSDKFIRCVTEKTLIYALGRGLEYSESELVGQLAEEMATNENKLSVLIQGIVRSEAFHTK